MSKYAFFGLIIFPLFLSVQPAWAQQKVEKESRIRGNHVPSKAWDLIDTVRIEGPVRWYLEEGLNHKSIEAKYYYNKRFHSVEFDTVGNLQDIEIEVGWVELKKPVQDAILAVLKEDCRGVLIKKIQVQYSGNPSILISHHPLAIPSDDHTVRYEMEVKCKQSGPNTLFEYLFDEKGQKLSKVELIIQNSSNLEF